MGTSASSMGPGAGVSLDPEWLDDIELPNQDNASLNDYNNDSGENDNQFDEKKLDGNKIPDIAPKFRFASARRGMGEYVRSGSKDSLRKSLGHYSKIGMGGARNLSKRMRTSTKVATNFFRTFQALRDNKDFALGKILLELQGRGANANEIIDTIIDNVCDETEGGYCKENLQLADSKDVAAATLAVVQLKENGIESLVKGMLTFAKGEERDLYLGVIERGLLEIGALLKEYNVI